MHELRKAYLLEVLESVEHCRYRALKILKIDLRTLRYWIKKYNLPKAPEKFHAKSKGESKRRYWIPDKTCAFCGLNFNSSFIKSNFCSRSCALKSYNKNKPKSIPFRVAFYCVNCDKTHLKSPGSKQRFCSKLCVIKFINKKRRNENLQKKLEAIDE